VKLWTHGLPLELVSKDNQLYVYHRDVCRGAVWRVRYGWRCWAQGNLSIPQVFPSRKGALEFLVLDVKIRYNLETPKEKLKCKD